MLSSRYRFSNEKMSITLTEAEYREHQLKYGREKAAKEAALGFARAYPVKLHPQANSAKNVAKKPSKHGNEPVIVDGIKFKSGREAKRWMELKALYDSGKISCLERQVCYILAEAVILNGRKKPAIRYYADFEYINSHAIKVVEDCKSPHLRKNPVFRLKQHLMMSVHGIDILLT